MDLLDRYLQAVKFLLPSSQKEDILAELSDDIRSHIEEQETGLGRKLDEAELEAILKRWGHPMQVAGRYLPQQYLIGPVLLPLYRLVLKMVLGFYLIPWLLVWFSFVLFVPTYRAEHPGFSLLGTLGTWWITAVYVFGFVTAGFAFAERRLARSGFFDSWSPRKLPVARDPNRIPRSESIGELVGGMVFVLWWVDLLRLPSIPGVTVTPAPLWSSFYWPILLVVLASVVLAGVNTFRPWWTRMRSGLHLAIDSLGLALVCYLFTTGPWVRITASNLPMEKAAELAEWINLSVLITLAVAAVILGIAVFRGIRRTLRSRTTPRGVANGLPHPR
ncbi:MAG TPA: hypothetical protein VF756_27780 [Thermoanaerobaculia bacterium]